jgi:NADH:ubiquinone oxidoreductase subunit
MSRQNFGVPSNWHTWLALATAAASLGLLPRGWQKALGVVSALTWLYNAVSE